jgi:hypothetical protein
MADAIDRKQHGIGAADEPFQHPAALLDAAIMVQESGTGTLGRFAQMSDLGRSSADVK